jgi:hypothetical protein
MFSDEHELLYTIPYGEESLSGSFLHEILSQKARV